MTSFPERIVCVDDDQKIRNLVKESLRRHDENLVVVTCGSGQELLSRFRELQPDLILMDLVMPNMDGPTLVEELFKRYAAETDPEEEGEEISKTPIIFLTEKEKVEMLERYKSLGVIGVIHKPFEPDELPAQIEEMYATLSEDEPH